MIIFKQRKKGLLQILELDKQHPPYIIRIKYRLNKEDSLLPFSVGNKIQH